MKIKISEAKDQVLDYLVAKCENFYTGSAIIRLWNNRVTKIIPGDYETGEVYTSYTPSTDWAQGGPIIEREKISVLRGNDLYFPKGNENGEFYEPLWIATRIEDPAVSEAWGTTPLIAAMRCYVASKLGDEVEVPDDLR